MNKEEIINKAQNEQGLDERERSVYGSSFGIGGVVMALLCVAFSAVAWIKGRPAYEFGVILFGYQAATQFHQYAKIKRRTYLIGAIACLVAALGGVAGYLIAELG